MGADTVVVATVAAGAFRTCGSLGGNLRAGSGVVGGEAGGEVGARIPIAKGLGEPSGERSGGIRNDRSV